MALWDLLSRRGARGTLHAHNGQDFDHHGWDEVMSRAEGMAAGLRAAGVRPGVKVASILTNSVDVVAGLFAVWMAGGALASLPVPTRGMTPAEYGRQLTTLMGRLDAPLLMVEERFAGLVPDEVRAALPVRSWESLPTGARIEPCPPGEDDVAFIQYSSGSTSVPKGCALTPRAIAAQLVILLDLAGGRPGDTIACWLPLSHDMGMFGCLLNAWAHDFDLVLSTPERFMFSPRTWFRDMATYGATMTAGTSTALHLATRAQRGELDGPLKLRVFVIGAERVEWDVLDRAAAVFAPYGLTRKAFMPAYGLAEATLAAAVCPWDAVPGHVTVDGYQLADGRVVEIGPDDPFATKIVSCGPPCRGVEIAAGAPGELAEILIASPSLASGYYGDPERTAERFVDGRLHTGDLGFMRDGELYVVGRSDDLISVGGRNVYAREIEAAIDDLDLVRKGCAVVVDVPGPGRSELVLFVELRRQLEDYGDFASAAATVAMQKAGVALSHCLFLAKGSLPKTPSGKIQRFRCRQLLLEDRFTPLARVTF
jgi:fatty-acyl-CoA synthase